MSEFRIPKDNLKEKKPNFINFDDLNRFVVFKNKDSIKVIKNLCPHMGAAFNKDSYCKKTNRMHCPWHGYQFSIDSLELVKNPNIDYWIRNLVESDSPFLKLRKLKMIEVKFTENDNHILIPIKKRNEA